MAYRPSLSHSMGLQFDTLVSKAVANISANKLIDTTIAITIYLLTCRLLRNRRARATQASFYTNPDPIKHAPSSTAPRPLSTMTVDESHLILRSIMELEFPTMYEKGLQLALFRTYGIPSVSRVLLTTTQLCGSAVRVGKRYADTAVLVSEIYGNAVTSERGTEAVARLNFLHGGYVRSGKIKNEDMLYTLALFMAHPVQWIERTEWRGLTEVERCAVGVWHLSMGRAMEIKFDVLPAAKTGWRDGVHFYEELRGWAERYEEENMLPDTANHQIAKSTRHLMLTAVPGFMHGGMTKLISAAMDERLREAVMFEGSGRVMSMVLKGIFNVRKWVLKHLTLPRPEWRRSTYIAQRPSKDGRRFVSWYDATPHYVRPSFRNRFGFMASTRRLWGAPIPGDDHMAGQGFLTTECGPATFLHQGQDEAAVTQRKLLDETRRGCPVGIVN